MDIVIRKARLEDLRELSLLFDSYRQFYRQPSDQEGAWKFLAERIHQNESEIYLADEKGDLLGFAQFYPIFSSTKMKRLWLLNDLYVHPSARRKGVANLLLIAGRKLVRRTDAAGFYLETEKSNVAGNQLYESFEMELDKEHNYYSWTPQAKS